MKPLDIINIKHKKFLENERLFFTYWSPTNLCNYDCRYCDIHRKEKFVYIEKQLKIVDFINFISREYDNQILLYGGEPTIDPNILRIINNLENPYNIRFYTNLSGDSMFYKNILELNKPMIFSISYHYEKANFDKFFEKLTYLTPLKLCKIRVKVMWDSRFKEEILEKFEILEELKMFSNYDQTLDLIYPNRSNNIGAEWNNKDIDLYLSYQKMKDIYVEYNDDGILKNKIMSFNEIWLNHLERNHYYTCYVGKSSLFIDSNGDVYYCKNQSYNPHAPIFNVVRDNYNDYLDIFECGLTCPRMGFCCETSIPKHRVVTRVKYYE